MNASAHQGNAPAPPPINWATRPQTSANLQDDVARSGTPIRKLVPVLVDPDDLGDLQEALRLVGQPTHQQRMPVSQDNVIVDMSNLQALLRHLGHRTPPQSWPEVHEDACLDGRDPTSDSQDLTSAFSCLLTSANSSPVRLLAARTVASVPARSNLSTPANTTASANSSPVHSLAVRTVPRVSTRTSLSTPANTMASTSGAPSLPLGVRTTPVAGDMSLQAGPRKKKYYVVVVGKCTGIYYEHW